MRASRGEIKIEEILKEAGFSGYGYMSPYYAPNGMPYVYNVETNSIEEIVTED